MVDSDLISMSGSGDAGPGRRDFLKLAAGATGIAFGGVLLDACSSSTSSSASGTGTTAPKRGGILRVGLTGGGTNDSLNPNLTITIPAFSGLAMLYDCVISLDDNMVPHYALATEVEPEQRCLSVDDPLEGWRHVPQREGPDCGRPRLLVQLVRERQSKLTTVHRGQTSSG